MTSLLSSLKIILGILLLVFLALGVTNFFYAPLGKDYFNTHVLNFIIWSTLLLCYSIYAFSTGWVERYRNKVDSSILVIGIIGGAVFTYRSLQDNMLMSAMFMIIVACDVIILYVRKK